MNTRRLAIRALNEARRADPLAYLSLRNTIGTTAGIKDIWAREIAPAIVRDRSKYPIIPSKLYKEFDESGSPKFRNVRYPGGPQQLAEAALIEACSIAGGAFSVRKSVYSYHFEARYGMDGVFRPYFELFAKRQDDIGKRCKTHSNHSVVYLDIKNFYPSIKYKRLKSKWEEACSVSQLDSKWLNLGNKLIDDQFSQKDGLLIGPLFSHLLANLYLRDFDRKMEKDFKNRYFRYVDDFVFLVPPKDKGKLMDAVKVELEKLGLRLNPKKEFEMPAKIWQQHAPFQSSGYEDEFVGDEEWMHFIDRLKRYLVVNPNSGPKVRSALIAESLRIPIPRYESATSEKIYQKGFERRRHRTEFESETERISIDSIVSDGLSLRRKYSEELMEFLEEFSDDSILIRKWKLTRIRYLIGRSFLVASEKELKKIFELIQSKSELADYLAMLEPLVTGEADQLLQLGWKPCFAIAPIIAACGIDLKTSISMDSQETIEAFTALRLGGVNITTEPSLEDSDNIRLTILRKEVEGSEWASFEDCFYREFHCLAGRKSLTDLINLFNTPIDPDENWSISSDELLGLNPT